MRKAKLTVNEAARINVYVKETAYCDNAAQLINNINDFASRQNVTLEEIYVNHETEDSWGTGGWDISVWREETDLEYHARTSQILSAKQKKIEDAEKAKVDEKELYLKLKAKYGE